MPSSVSVILSMLKNQNKKVNMELKKSAYIQAAIDCFKRDYHYSKDIVLDDMDNPRTSISKLKISDKNKRILSSYIENALLLHEYAQSVPTYDLAVVPAAQMLVANLVSLGIIPVKKEEALVGKLLIKWKVDTVKETDELMHDFNNAVSELNIPELSITNKDRVKRLIDKAFLESNLGATYGTDTFTYSLEDALLYALDQYEDFHPKISTERANDIRVLRKLIIETKGNRDTVKGYLNGPDFKTSLRGSSHLKTLCMRAMKNYDSLPSTEDHTALAKRVIRTKTYRPEPEKDQGTHILAIHGLEDGLKTWDVLAQKWRTQGCTVHTYDQTGHGFDENRTTNSSLEPTQMQIDFYMKLKKVLVEEKPKPKKLIIYAHSLGGALVANSLRSIEKLAKGPPETSIEVKLITPAAMIIKNPLSLLGKRGQDTTEEVSQKRKIGPSREGAIKLWDKIGQFIRFMGRARTNLEEHLKKGESQTKIKLTVIQGKVDKKVDFQQFNAVDNQHTVTVLEGGHNLHQEQKNVEALTKPTSPSPK